MFQIALLLMSSDKHFNSCYNATIAPVLCNKPT